MQFSKNINKRALKNAPQNDTVNAPGKENLVKNIYLSRAIIILEDVLFFDQRVALFL